MSLTEEEKIGIHFAKDKKSFCNDKCDYCVKLLARKDCDSRFSVKSNPNQRKACYDGIEKEFKKGVKK